MSKVSILKFYRGRDGWRWRVRDKWAKHLILGASSQGYSNRKDCALNYARLSGFDCHPAFVTQRQRCFAWEITEQNQAEVSGTDSIHRSVVVGSVSRSWRPLSHEEALRW